MHQLLQGYRAAGPPWAFCLKHMYPACQASPSFLKSRNELLYEILQTEFVLSAIPATSQSPVTICIAGRVVEAFERERVLHQALRQRTAVPGRY